MDFIDVISPDASKNVDELNSKLTTMIKNVATLNSMKVGTPSGADTSIKKLTADYVKQEKVIADLQIKLERLAQTQARSKIVANQLEQSNIRLEKSIEAKNKALDREQQQLQKSENVYNKIQAKINAMIPTYNNLQAKQKLGVSLTAKEEAQLRLLETRLVKYQNILKETDAQIGKHGRSVGDYAKGTSNLSNSIGQISRELPNFGQSFSIGVLSLTNNVGALIDGIKQVKEENKNLIEQGQEAKSVFSQLKSAIFSWQTALFVGIGIFSAYSKEISDWVESLWKGSEAIQNVAKAQKEMNKVRLESNKSTIDEKTRINELISVSKNQTISLEERQIALKKLRNDYPFYFKDLKDEAILNGDVAGSLNKLALAVDKRALADKKDELIIKNKERLLELQNESNKKLSDEANELEKFDKAYNRKIKTREQYLADVKKKFTNLSDWLIVGDDQKFKDQLIEIAGLQKINAEAQKEVNQLRAESIGLDFQLERTDKTKRERVKLNYAEVESEYNLKLAILERQKAQINDRVENEDLNLDIRLKAREEFSEKSIEILELQTNKEKALRRETYLDDLEKNNLAYKNKDITAKEWSENIQHLNKRLSNELQTIDLNYSLSWNDLMNANAKFYKDIQDKKKEYTEQTNKLIYESEKASFDKISNDAKKTLTTRQKAFEQSLELSRKELQLNKIKDIANAKSSEEIALINQRYADALKNLKDLESPLKKAREETEAFIHKISGGALEKGLSDLGLSSAKMFLDFDLNGQTTFDKLMEGADTLAEKFAVTFNGISEIAQEAFNFIAEMSNANFQNEYENLEKQKNIALLFAGDSASAKEEIERQAEQKRKEIARREFQAQKAQALFNIAVNTAQAIVGALATLPSPSAVPLSIAVGAIGALQLGVVASRQIPEFWKGTDNAPEGWALTQEKGREIITDKYGNIKSTGSDKGAQYTYLNKGDKVLNNDKTMDFLMFNNDLNAMLSNNQIGMPIVNVESNKTDLTPVVNAINDKPIMNLSIGKNGLDVYVGNGHTKKEIVNRRTSFRGFGV